MKVWQIHHIREHQAEFETLTGYTDVEEYAMDYGDKPDLYERLCDDMEVAPRRKCERCGYAAVWRCRTTMSGKKFRYFCTPCFSLAAVTERFSMEPPYAQHKSRVKNF